MKDKKLAHHIKRAWFVICFYIRWIIHLRVTIEERRYYMRDLTEFKKVNRYFLSFLEYKKQYYIFIKNHNEKMAKLTDKINSSNEKERKEMLKNHLELENLEREL